MSSIEYALISTMCCIFNVSFQLLTTVFQYTGQAGIYSEVLEQEGWLPPTKRASAAKIN